MTDTLLNKISKFSNDTIISDAWLTGQTGEIVDLKGDCIFRFVDYDTEGELRIKHTTEESQLSCPIVACGLVGYWLHKKDSEGTKAIFDGYYELCLKNYEKAHECDDDAWERDFKKEFVCRHHVPTEKKWIKASEALFLYITESDQKKVKSIMANYLKYARSKRKQLYPPNHPTNRIIEDTFLDAYRVGGPANECMSWMRTEYNLPYQWPHWSKDNKTAKDLLSGRWKERHDKIIPEYIAEEYEDFDDRVLKYTNGGLMEEIDENLKNFQTQEDRIRYIISLLQPFKEFADAFDAKARIDERKRGIKEHEKWIKDWESMPDDAVDERTGEPIRPKDQIAACVESIEEYKKDIEYWKKVQQDFYWFAQHGLGAGDYRVYPQEVNDDMCKYLGGWWECMIFFARRLAALALTYGIKLMDVQERCEIYLMWHFMITDYVDEKYITSIEHARNLLDEIDAKKPKNEPNSKVEPSEIAKSKRADNISSEKVEAPQKKDSDFELLKTWQNNSSLDYYLSEEHWNYHVNTLLYKNLLVFHEGKELGAFLDVSGDSFTQPIKDYTPLYGNLFNEAYRLSNIVLTTPVPQTKVAWFANQAATWKFRDLKDEDGNPYEIAPNVIDLIESYHILGMVNAILTFSNVQKDTVNEFLIALSVYNDNGMYFCGNTHRFEPYNEVYEAFILANIVNGTMLHPEYDHKNRDKYLRHNIPWYEHLAGMLEEEKQKAKEQKTTSIQEQNQYNTQVFNGPVTIIKDRPTRFHQEQRSKFWFDFNNQKTNKASSTTAPLDEKPGAVTEKKMINRRGVNHRSNRKPKVTRPTPPLTLKYYRHGTEAIVDKQKKRVEYLFEKWNLWGWLDVSANSNDFDKFFEGKDRDCNLILARGVPPKMTIFLECLLKYEIPKGMGKEKLIVYQTHHSARSIVEGQFKVTANSIKKRLSPVDWARIKESIYILDYTLDLPRKKGGDDEDYDLSDETLQLYSANIDLGIKPFADVEQAVKSGKLRPGNHT